MSETEGAMGLKRDTRRAAARVSRHSALVRHLRLAVPALAAGLVLTYAFSATPPRIDRSFAEQFSSAETTEEGVRLSSPRYSGEDLSGRPFEVNAASAIRGTEARSKVALENPEARTVSKDGRSTTLRASEGAYDETGKRIDLTSDVELTQSGEAGDFRIETDAAELDLEKGVVSSKGEVRGAGEGGTIRADKGTLYQDEDRLILEGGVEITLEPKAAKSDTDERDDNDS